jgi:2-oxoisovalerate dehydrogenase E2 component (dihydrolipoyl transacylase)
MILKLRLSTFRSFHSSTPLNRLVPFLLADIGEGITEVEVLQWHVKEGNTVKQFDKLAEVQSDKATVEITSRYDGIIKKIHYPKGATAKVGTPLVNIEIEGEDTLEVTAPSIAKVEPQSKAHNEPTSVKSAGSLEQLKHPVVNENEVKAMPGVRHYARVNGVDINRITASGKSGQIVKADIDSFLSGKGKATSAITDVSAYDLVPLNAFQKAMAKSMQTALTIPHFGFHDEVPLDMLSGLRRGLVSAVEERYGVRVTMMAFYIKALSLALKDYPVLNSHFDSTSNAIRHYRAHNVGVAVDTEHGLAVPVIKRVQDLSILDVARELGRLSEAARQNKLSSEELGGGTITLSNIGSIGGTTASPIIVAPQVCIAALGRTQMLPRFNERMELVPKNVMPVSWSADHRVIDGATVARFSRRWGGLLEDPSNLLLHLTQP